MAARRKKGSHQAAPARRRGGFVGRDSSPVLEKYPPKDPSLSPAGRRGPPSPPRAGHDDPIAPGSPAAAPAPTGPSPGNAPATPLITLDRPFNVDEFASLLGETSIRVTVPRESLGEVLQRVTEFMGFGIYVYSIGIRPAPSDLLKAFVVELQRVDFSAAAREWVPFQDKGTSDSPFGPAGTRT